MPLPIVRPSSGLSTRDEARVSRMERRVGLRVYQEALQIAAAVEIERLEAEAARTVLQTQLDCEFALLDYGLSRAGGSAAKTQLVAEKVSALSSYNAMRFRRTFG